MWEGDRMPWWLLFEVKCEVKSSAIRVKGWAGNMGGMRTMKKMYEMAISNNRKDNVLGKESVELELDHVSLTPDLAWFLLKCILLIHLRISSSFKHSSLTLYPAINVCWAHCIEGGSAVLREKRNVSLIEQVLQVRRYVRHFIISYNQVLVMRKLNIREAK